MKSNWLSGFILLILLVIIFSPKMASGLMRKISPEELTAEADLIVIGEVTKIESRRATGEPIYTYVTIATEEIVKGISKKEVTLRYLGGEVDGEGMWVSDMPSFKLVEKVKVFLKGKDIHSLVGSYQGKHNLDEKGVFRLLSDPCYIYDGLHWPGPNPMGEDYNIKPDIRVGSCETQQQQIDAIMAGARAWNNEGCANFAFTYGGTHGRTIYNTPDGYNDIAFQSMGSECDYVATAHVYYSDSCYQCYHRHIYECDMIFNIHCSFNCVGDPDTTEADIWNTAAHEFGHFLTLEDLYGETCTLETMHVMTSGGEIKSRDLSAGDIAGIQHIYGKASNCNPILTNDSLAPSEGNCETVFSFYIDYYDEDGDSPDTAYVYIDSVAYPCTLYTGDADSGTYRCRTTLLGQDDPYNYYFYFTDVNGGSDTEPVLWGKDGPTVNFKKCGDMDGDCDVDIEDLVYLGNYLFKSGPAPKDMWAADVNCDEGVDVNDYYYLYSYLLLSGPDLACCEE